MQSFGKRKTYYMEIFCYYSLQSLDLQYVNTCTNLGILYCCCPAHYSFFHNSAPVALRSKQMALWDSLNNKRFLACFRFFPVPITFEKC